MSLFIMGFRILNEVSAIVREKNKGNVALGGPASVHISVIATESVITGVYFSHIPGCL